MKIVILDGYTLNPGDLSWEELRKLGEVDVYDRTPPDQVVERASNAEVVLTNKTKLSSETLKQLPNLRYVGVLATGYDVVDVNAAREQKVMVTNIPAYGTHSVAQFAIALLLELAHHVHVHAEASRSGEWSANPDWSYPRTPLVELAGKTMGIVGFGRIGRQTAKLAAAFGMRVLAHVRTERDAPDYWEFRFASMEELFAESDVISLHCPLTPETKGLVNQARLAHMKPTSLLINTARGPLIVEPDLAEALNSGRIAGAALDVLSTEPPPKDNPLLTARNCIVTPHIAWATKEARTRLLATATANIAAFVNGDPANVVNP
jgi:glycerate dehydrogenase